MDLNNLLTPSLILNKIRWFQHIKQMTPTLILDLGKISIKVKNLYKNITIICQQPQKKCIGDIGKKGVIFIKLNS